MANGSESNGDWKVWAIKLGFGLVTVLIPIMLGLAALSYNNLKSEATLASTGLRTDLARMEQTLEKHTIIQSQLSEKQDKRFDELCQKVREHGVVLREHDILLRQPWQQRKDYYNYNRGLNFNSPKSP